MRRTISPDMDAAREAPTSRQLPTAGCSRSFVSETGDDERGSGARSLRRVAYKSTFGTEERIKIVENFSGGLEENRLHEALGFFESRRRVPPVIFDKSSVLINVRSGNELVPLELEAFGSDLETALNKLSHGDPVQFFFIQRNSAKQLVFARPVERDDPVCKLHKMSLAASGPLFPLNTTF